MASKKKRRKSPGKLKRREKRNQRAASVSAKAHGVNRPVMMVHETMTDHGPVRSCVPLSDEQAVKWSTIMNDVCDKRRCILCGAPARVLGMFMHDSENLVEYALCAECLAKPDAMSQARAWFERFGSMEGCVWPS